MSFDRKRIEKAIDIAVRYGGFDGAHHKSWVIDQMVRALTNCPTETRTAIDCDGKSYTFEDQGESEEYRELIANAKSGKDGPDTYEWDVGIAP